MKNKFSNKLFARGRVRDLSLVMKRQEMFKSEKKKKYYLSHYSPRIIVLLILPKITTGHIFGYVFYFGEVFRTSLECYVLIFSFYSYTHTHIYIYIYMYIISI